MATYTRTHFFSEEDLAPLRAEQDKLSKDWDDRSPHIPEPLRTRGNDRILNLRIAVDILGEVAD